MSRPAVPALLLGIVAVVVLAAVGGGVWVMGSPTTQRLLRLDERRVKDLRAISEAVDRYWTDNERLPENLAALSGSTTYSLTIRDPETGGEYRYLAGEGKSYRLCADFALASEAVGSAAEAPGTLPGTWSHGTGPHCFDLETCACDRPRLR